MINERNDSGLISNGIFGYWTAKWIQIKDRLYIHIFFYNSDSRVSDHQSLSNSLDMC